MLSGMILHVLSTYPSHNRFPNERTKSIPIGQHIATVFRSSPNICLCFSAMLLTNSSPARPHFRVYFLQQSHLCCLKYLKPIC